MVLLRNSEVQNLLKDEPYRNLVGGVEWSGVEWSGVEWSGSNEQVASNPRQGCPSTTRHVLGEQISHTPDCLFLYLRSNPCVCTRNVASRSVVELGVDKSV
jgi:hypothetical protein